MEAQYPEKPISAYRAPRTRPLKGNTAAASGRGEETSSRDGNCPPEGGKESERRRRSGTFPPAAAGHARTAASTRPAAARPPQAVPRPRSGEQQARPPAASLLLLQNAPPAEPQHDDKTSRINTLKELTRNSARPARRFSKLFSPQPLTSRLPGGSAGPALRRRPPRPRVTAPRRGEARSGTPRRPEI